MGKEPTTYTTTQVTQITGATYRMLDHWARCGYIPGQCDPVGSGHRRRWTESQLDRVRLLAMASEIKNAPLDKLADQIAGHLDCALVA